MPEIQEKCVILQYHVKSLSKRFYTFCGQFIGLGFKIRIYYLAVLISENPPWLGKKNYEQAQNQE